MTFELRVVLLCPTLHKGTFNSSAGLRGHGPRNLNRELLDEGGNPWSGCHVWANQKLLDDLTTPPINVARDMKVEILGAGDCDTWDEALAKYGLVALPETLEPDNTVTPVRSKK